MTALVTQKLQSVPAVNTVAGVLSGSATSGSVLTCTPGTWTGTPPLAKTYQFRRDGVDFGSATADNTYTTTEDDEGSDITCVPIVTNSNGAIRGTESNAIGVVAP